MPGCLSLTSSNLSMYYYSEDEDGGQGDERGEVESTQPRAEEPMEEEAPRINVEIPRCVAQLGSELYFVKLPNFLSVETRYRNCRPCVGEPSRGRLPPHRPSAPSVPFLSDLPVGPLTQLFMRTRWRKMRCWMRRVVHGLS